MTTAELLAAAHEADSLWTKASMKAIRAGMQSPQWLRLKKQSDDAAQVANEAWVAYHEQAGWPRQRAAAKAGGGS